MVRIRWETAGDGVCYFVDDVPVDTFEDVLDRVAAGPHEPVTIEFSELGLGGADIADTLPFALGELSERLEGRPLLYQVF